MDYTQYMMLDLRFSSDFDVLHVGVNEHQHERMPHHWQLFDLSDWQQFRISIWHASGRLRRALWHYQSICLQVMPSSV